MKWFKGRFWVKLLLPTRRCSVCHKPLNNMRDRKRGMGASCWKKKQAAAPATGGATL